jgi:hypothetical protein
VGRKGTVGGFDALVKGARGVIRVHKEFRRRVARRYVRDATKGLAHRRGALGRVSVAMRALSEPGGEQDLTFDWRWLVDGQARTLRPEAVRLIEDSLASGRDALQAAFHSPEVLLDLDLPLPLAFLVGYEWRLTTRLRLVPTLRTGVTSGELQGEGDVTPPPESVREALGGAGPVVLAVSCRDGLREAAQRYASVVDARELITLHVPGILQAPAIRGLARVCARELGRLNDRGLDKHLLLMGPSALALLAGAAANATGPVKVPFWNGSLYTDGVLVGA